MFYFGILERGGRERGGTVDDAEEKERKGGVGRVVQVLPPSKSFPQ